MLSKRFYMTKAKGLFLDRDGIVNIDKSYVHKREDIEFVEGIFDLCSKASELGYKIFIVTNQAGIAKGMFKEEDVQKLHDWMSETFLIKGIKIHEFSFCPHHPDFTGECNCRKPEPLMINNLAEKYEIDKSKSVMIGDKPSDTKAGKNAGIKTCILVKSRYFQGEQPSADHIVNTLQEAADLI
jgi:D-glycero-D-manno-heptose 1,7-bisphosphate phosphatase